MPAINKDSITEDGFVMLNSTYLRTFFKDYLSYLDYLRRTGVIICNNRYLTGKQSLGYKFSSLYKNARLTTYIYISVQQNADSISPIPEEVYSENDRSFIYNTLQSFLYLSHWYLQKKLTIDVEKARDYAYKSMVHKYYLGYSAWDMNKNKWSQKNNDYCRKYPRTQYNAVMVNIESINLGDYKVMIDTNVHRLHSVITNIQKDYRNFLTYDNKQLVNIDIANSQPYLLCLLLNPLFWDRK